MSQVRVSVWPNERTEVQAVTEGGFGGICRISFRARSGAVYFGDVGADRFEPTVGRSKLVLLNTLQDIDTSSIRTRSASNRPFAVLFWRVA